MAGHQPARDRVKLPPNGKRRTLYIAAIGVAWTIVTNSASYYAGWQQKIRAEGARDFQIDELIDMKPSLRPLPGQVNNLDTNVRTLVTAMELLRESNGKLSVRMDMLTDAINRREWGVPPRGKGR